MGRHFLKEDIQMASQCMKICLISHAIREIKIKTTVDTTLLIRMAKIQMTDNTKWWQGNGAPRTLIPFWWGCEMAQPLWKTVGSFVKI